jgi:hypothetical protein
MICRFRGQMKASAGLALMFCLLSSSHAQQLMARAGGAADAEAAPAPAPASAAFAPAPAPGGPGLESGRLVSIDWSLIAGAGVLRYLDYRSTEQCASDPRDFREYELPESLVRNKPALAAFESGTVVVNYYVYRWVARRHRKLARAGQAINLGAVGLAVGGNYLALFEHYPRRHLPLAMPNRP